MRGYGVFVDAVENVPVPPVVYDYPDAPRVKQHTFVVNMDLSVVSSRHLESERG